jgi:peroxiredoxin
MFMAKTQSSQKLVSGSPMPKFNLKGVDGKNYSSDDIKSRSIVVVFICNHCPYVKARINDLVNLQAKFNPSDLQIIGINSNDPDYADEGFENMKIFSDKYSLNFPYLIDDTQRVAKEFGAVCTPDPFLFDENKFLVFHGKINDALDPDAIPTINTMEENVKKLLDGKKSSIEPSFDPSIGCSIKWIS